MGLQQNILVVDGKPFDHYFLCHYKPYSSGVDRLSRSLIRFKNNYSIDVQAWIDCSVQELKAILLSENFTIVRALHSYEKEVIESNLPLDHLCMALSSHTGSVYEPGLLTKKKTTQSLKSLSATEREDVMRDLYSFTKDSVIKSLLIVDDIFTRGTTLAAIVRAIRAVTDCEIILYTLATTNRNDILNNTQALHTSSYRWHTQSGWSSVQEAAQDYLSDEQLRGLILSDFDKAL